LGSLALSPDGQSLVYDGGGQLHGKTVLFTVATDEGSSDALVSVQTGEHRTLFAGSSARYVSTGHIVFFRSGDLLVDGFDLSSLEAAGTPVPIVGTVSGFLWSGVVHARYALSTSGRLVYRWGPVLPDVEKLVWVERDGQSRLFFRKRWELSLSAAFAEWPIARGLRRD
jgi:hypothetical protein